uniref:Amino acid transporter transmembrane domain-containing protein n=1 Tax=Chenopodium quinoa TaxID=63459 RepID=A0A803NDC9_CHEQI
MGTYIVETQVVPEENTIVNQESNHERKEELDAGALFVLQSKGSWVHCGYHLTTSIVAPALLSLPYAFKFLGWAGGIICLILGAMVTFYSYNLLSLVLEHHAQLGRRHLRFRDMAHDILGPRWGRYIVGPVQFAVCYGAVVGACLIGGQCIKAIYLLFNPNGTMKLYEFIIIFGGLMLILAQMPSFHSLRHINLISLLLCLGYSAAATVGSVYIGHKSKGPEKDYSLVGNSEDRLFGVFNAIAIIATTFGNGIIPEIQCRAVSGYWAFGNQAEGQILSNFVVNGNPFLPKWFIFMTNAFVILQISAVGVIYLQPTNEVLEGVLADPKSGQFSLRNVIPRVISRSLSVAIATIISAMLPFFGDINGVIGAFGFLPLDFVLPVILFNLTFKPSKRTFIFWLNLSIAVVFSILGVIGSVAAVRQIILDAKSYKLFANV